MNFIGFVLADERKARGFNPVTRRTLDAKCAALLPASLVAGRTVADLGACLALDVKVVLTPPCIFHY